MSTFVFRKFGEELNAFLGKPVMVITAEGKEYAGVILGIDEGLNLVLDKVTGAGENVFKLVLNGSNVREVRLTAKPFDYKALGERLNKVFPGLVQVREEIGTIIVMDKIKVTEKGVEGTGLAVDKAKTIYDEYIRDTKK
ncbi:MAG: Lsm family RNA-binding protein [Thaumarchaeota archaeon]|nr:Lsm family RNA-binding protein [Nitrososphaerota archaeon]